MPSYALVLVAALLIMALLQGELRKVRLARKTWGELLREVKTVNMGSVTLAALECDPQVAFEPHEVWTMIGGWEGLKRMRANAQLLIALATHATNSNSDGRCAVEEQMLCDARAIHKAVSRIRFQLLFGKKIVLLSADVLIIVSAYYRMSDRLLTLFERSPLRRYGQLTAVVWPL